MSFFYELWESIFTPGASAALLKATHGSFVLLHITLAFLVYYTHSIHFVNLFVIAALLHALVTWFVAELQRAQHMDNQELASEQEKNSTSASATGAAKKSAKKRKA